MNDERPPSEHHVWKDGAWWDTRRCNRPDCYTFSHTSGWCGKRRAGLPELREALEAARDQAGTLDEPLNHAGRWVAVAIDMALSRVALLEGEVPTLPQGRKP